MVPRWIFVVLFVLASAIVGLPRSASPAGAENPVQRENALPGTPNWSAGAFRDSPLQGYSSAASIAPGELLQLHVSAPVDYRVEIVRIGWYGGAGGRLVACLPGCLEYRSGALYGATSPDPGTGEVRLSWPVTDQLQIPADWASGYYVALLAPSNGGVRGTIPFVVREGTERRSAILVEVPVNTWQAYNAWGGKSLYDFNSTSEARANRVSFDRPYLWEGPGSQAVSAYELPTVRFLEREGYDVSYATDVDVDRDPGLFLRHRIVIVAGHGEYWTGAMRDAFDATVRAGTNIAFLGANIGYWQVRFENDRRTMVGYKSFADPEPDRSRLTVLFRDLLPPRPECSLLGVQHYTGSYAWPRGDFRVTAEDPWLAGTGLTAASSVAGVVSREHDQIPAGSPPGESCGLKVTVLFRHEGADPLERAEAIRYTAPSGARVFSAGSLEFGWSLDDYRVNGDGADTPVDPGAQRFVRNVLADMTLAAAPARVAALRLRRSTRVTVIWTDPRITGALVFRHRGPAPFAPGDPGVTQACRSAVRICVDSARLRPGSYRYSAFLVDEWGRSAPRLSAAVRVPQPARPPKR